MKQTDSCGAYVRRIRIVAALLCVLAAGGAALPAFSFAEPASAVEKSPAAEGDTSYTGWVDAGGDPCGAASAAGWVDAGVRARSKFLYDPGTGEWYWAEADGSIARDHDALVPTDNSVAGSAWEQASAEWRSANGKWVHLGPTGAVQRGFLLLPDGDGLKWVFCDYVTGEMAHGERYIDDSHGDEPGWMYFDPVTGAADYGWAWIPSSGKWVYYDEVSGRMRYGSLMVGGRPYYLDPDTGERLPRERVVARLLAAASSQDGVTDGDRYQNAAIQAGSSFNSFGPCTAFVYWCFQEAGLHYQFMDGGATTWPHELCDWYTARGRMLPRASRPQPGDLWIDNYPATRPFPSASATHSGIVDHVSANGRTVYVWEHVNGYVHLCAERYDLWYLTGYAQPYYNEM
ncbi:CHAP domain-containing protein [Collinsella tanakaei]|uniref:CHAP domain-containing protein n=1 Tax=Collinsella tanakaei TaxID=626935 RepID=UPI00195D5DDC|nr:CHAP domain-containing protein [Collinsella tanakaei]MBM6757045.1 CHAP domain-containing protein [Collinsella tanakaei]